MEYKVVKGRKAMGEAAAQQAAEWINHSVQQKGRCVFIAATGASQFDFLEALVEIKEIDWSKTTMFHLDEYIGMPATHPASFRKYLKERFVDKVHPGIVHFVAGDNPQGASAECQRLGQLIKKVQVDVAFVGIGENGHLAFNDPPADFERQDPYFPVKLDEPCRRQQLGEGWFKNLDEVPQEAITMSIAQIMKSTHILAVVPDQRKAQAVKNCLTKPVSNLYPSSILQNHSQCLVFLDEQAASLL